MTKLTPSLRIAASIALASALAACATGSIDKPMTNQGETMHFKNLDTTGDGKITQDELPANHELLARFGSYDLNGNGEISEYEFGEYITHIPD